MKICVYSASSGQVDSSYVEAAGELGTGVINKEDMLDYVLHL